MSAATFSLCDRSRSVGHGPLHRRVLAFLRTLTIAVLTTGILCFAQNTCFAQNADENAHQAAPVPPQPVLSQSQTEAPSFTFIASLRLVTEPLGERKDNSKGIVLGWLHKSFCALTGAHELSYYLSPESRKDGLHRISVTSTRDGLTLYFRPLQNRSGQACGSARGRTGRRENHCANGRAAGLGC